MTPFRTWVDRWCIGIVLFSAVLSFLGLARSSLTLDEVITIRISKQWEAMWPILWNEEGNMWFYHLVMNGWLRLGDSEWMVRSASALAAVATVAAFYALCRDIVTVRVARLATLLLSTNLLFLFYAQVARGYAFALLFMTLSSFYFLRMVRGPSSTRTIVFYIVTTAIALYSHLLVGFIVIAHYLSSLVLGRRAPFKRLVAAGVGILLLTLPLLVAPARNGHQLDWLQPPPLLFLPLSFVTLAGDSVIVAALFGAVILWLFSARRSLFRPLTFAWLVLWAAFPPIAAFIFSWLGKPVFEPESFNSSLPAVVLLVAIGLEEIRSRRWTYRIAVSAIFFFTFLRLVGWYAGVGRPHLVLDNANPRDWKAVVEFVQQESEPGDAVGFYAYHIRYPFEYYVDRSGNPISLRLLELASDRFIISGGNILPDPDIELLRRLSVSAPRFWLVLSYHDPDWLNRRSQRDEIESELNRTHMVVREVRFGEIEVKLYQRPGVATMSSLLP